MTFWRLYYHLTWATKDREPLIQPTMEERLHGYSIRKAAELGVYVYAVNGWFHHMHIVVSIPPKLAVADVVKNLKGSSSHDIDHEMNLEYQFQWQRGYGALSFGERQRTAVIEYVLRQKEHHQQQTANIWLERADELDEGEMGISRYLHLRDHAEQLDQELADLQRLNGELRTDLDRVQYDPTRIEELARERLGYVRKGETVYQLDSDWREGTVSHGEDTMKFGSVAIIGRSNVGKSTLLNRLLKEKIAIVSDKPQTTRMRILGVAHVEGAQIVFIDTPGFHEPHHLLNRRMVRTTLGTFDDADVLYVVVEATAQPGPGDLAVIEHVKSSHSISVGGREAQLTVTRGRFFR